MTEYTDSNDKTVKYSYDQLGNMVSLTYPGGEIVTYTYRDDGSIATMKSKSGGTIYTWGYDYDRYGRLTEITRPDGSVETRTYNDAGLLISQVDKNKSGGILREIHYTYNVFGEVIQKDTSYNGDLSTLETVKMSYDDANRLVSYDGKEVEYDTKGNMVHGPVDGVMQDLTYDCRNRLISAGGVTYSYDAENNRIATTENGKTTTYIHDVSGSLSKLLIAYEADGSETSYYYGAEGLAGQYSNKTDERLYYHYDNIGSTTCVTNAIGVIVEQIAYGTYGELLTTVKNNIRFLYNGAYGVMTDSNGLYYMRARYYNPDIKRFINQDIKVGDIGNGQGLNRYAYCEGNPVSLIDPFGLSPNNGQEQTKESKYEWLHMALDVAGFVFDGADLINAAIYAAEGDWKNAVICGASAIPFVGTAIAGVAKGAKAISKIKKTTQLLGLAAEGGKIIKNAANATDAISDTLKVVAKHGSDTFKYADEVADEFVTKTMKALETGGDFGQEASKLAKNMDELASPGAVKLSTKADEAADALKATDAGGVAKKIIPDVEGGSSSVKRINVGDSGHHVPAVRKSKGRPFAVSRSDKTRPTIFSKGSDPGHDHWRLHDAEKNFVGPRQGDFIGTDDELFDAYRNAYRGLDDIKVDVKSPNGTYTLGTDVTPYEAVDLIQKWLKEQGLY